EKGLSLWYLPHPLGEEGKGRDYIADNYTQTDKSERMLLRRSKRAAPEKQIVTLKFVEGVEKTAKFDLCDVIKCEGRQVDYQCLAYSLQNDQWCKSWDKVIANTGFHDWGYNPKHSLKSRLRIIKGSVAARCGDKECNPLYLTLTNPNVNDTGLYVLGSYQSGTGPLGHFQINVTKNETTTIAPPTVSPMSDFQVGPKVTYLHNVTYESKLALETGYDDKNLWLEWMRYTAIQTDRTDCVACAKARPILGTAPFRLNNQNDPDGFLCTIQLFGTNATEANCSVYTCFSRTGQGISVGQMPKVYCTETINITFDTGNYTAAAFEDHNTSRADLWWLCGDKKLRPHLPSNWTGECALAQLLMPFHMIPVGAASFQMRPPHSPYQCGKRDAPGGSFDPTVYVDAIGVPRGVPNEFKARNQIIAGFESLFHWVSINKNVDWINYIYYNQQRFINYTRNAVKGIAEQLDPTSLMTWQNRMALDMLLAEKGGVCKMFGEYCCTYIPNNTAPDGSITIALAGLTSLSQELAENSGVNDPITSWLDNQFGRYKALIASMLISIGCFLAIIVCCGCCCIPCLRTLVNRKEPPPYAMPLLDDEDGSEDREGAEGESQNGVTGPWTHDEIVKDPSECVTDIDKYEMC
uniref:Uncharacterized protein n=1 Tax=Sparus aurata TaxID=8175 RepID=A0A671Y016_SPAAU